MLGFLPVLNIVLISLIAFYFRSCHTDLIWTLVIILGPASCRVEREPKLLNFERIWFWVRDCCYLGGTSGRTCMMCTGTFWVHAGSCQARFGLWTLRHILIQDTLVVGHYLYQKKNLKNHHRGWGLPRLMSINCASHPQAMRSTNCNAVAQWRSCVRAGCAPKLGHSCHFCSVRFWA